MIIHYKPEIDGLRTVAVLSVIFYHAQFIISGNKLLPGGLFGVDIFFVISGFLITSLITKEFNESGTISISKFYYRRARRLLPALLLVMLVSLPFAWMYLIPDQLIDYAKSLISSLLFGSNFYWDYSLQQYGAESGLVKPFLHTWSLAVEEQFYIVFPLTLLAIYRWGKTHIIIIFTAGILISLVFAEWMTKSNASFSFYMLPSRLWELLAGGLLAIIHSQNPQMTHPKFLNKTMPKFGLSLIAYSIAAIDYNGVNHPGFITLIPVTGTVLIIYYANEKELITKILSSKAFVRVGLISYALYLWHYPIFSFGRMINPQASPLLKTLWILVTFILSIASYLAIERPFRRSDKISPKLFYISITSMTLVILVFSSSVLLNDGFKEKWGYLTDLKKANSRIWVSQNGRKCHFGGGGHRPALGINQSCHFKYSPEGKSPLIVVGDSHAGSLAESINQLAKHNSIDFIQITAAGCTHIPSIHDGLCDERSKSVHEFIAKFETPTVIYSARLPHRIEGELFDNPEGWQEANYKKASPNHKKKTKPVTMNLFKLWLTQWGGESGKLVLIYPVPEQGFHINIRLAFNNPPIKSKEDLPDFSTSYDVFKERVADSYNTLDEVKGSNVLRIYPENIFCDASSERCMASEGDRVYFSSDNHLSPFGASLVIRKVAGHLGLKVPASFRE
jgi:peptidoglycan/LPS O-acetylase OafA/YrhL